MKHRSVLIYGKGEGMYTIAIVEDDKTQAASLKEYLLRYAAENGEAFAVKTFSNAVIFLENYTAVYDVVFMDIKMPYLNGIAAAHKLRELDKGVLLFFITSLTQYAIRGYEVDALNYIVKPVEYNEFALKFKKAVDRLAEKKSGELLVPTDMGYKKISPAEIYYVEVRGHHCKYHTTEGEYKQYQTIRSVEEKLLPYGFARCNNCYLVNLRHVSSVKDYTAIVGGDELQISHPRKKEFMRRLTAFFDGEKNG